MEFLHLGNNNLTTAASYIGGGGGGGGVPTSNSENIIQMAARLKTDQARPGHLENIKRRGNSDALLQRLGIQRAAWDRALAIYNGVRFGCEVCVTV